MRILGGLMALGYEIGPTMKRHTLALKDDKICIKFDRLEMLGDFIQIQGKDRKEVGEVARKLGMEGHYIPRSYIEQVCLN